MRSLDSAVSLIYTALHAISSFKFSGYYITIPMFKPWPMKKLSNLIGLLWEADPNKSLWSLMAKAWSTIRDQIGKDQAPLDQFFRIICPHLKLPDPASYLEIHGWILNVNGEGDPTISRSADSEFASIGTGNTDMALSVEDIITYVQSLGYAHGFILDDNKPSSTFLGQSVSSTLEKNTSAISATQATSKAAHARFLVRNKRRAKRQAVRNASYRASLDQDILIAHQLDPAPVDNHVPDCYSTTAPVLNQSPNQFYDGLTTLLSDQIPTIQDDAVHLDNAHLFNDCSLPGDVSFMNIDDFTTNMPNLIDYDAFRLGADEDVTLPIFDDITQI